MKNSPEENGFRELENRLRNYTEIPADAVWDNIQSGMSGNNTAGVSWKKAVAVSVIFLVSWIGYTSTQLIPASPVSDSETMSNRPVLEGASLTTNNANEEATDAIKENGNDNLKTQSDAQGKMRDDQMVATVSAAQQGVKLPAKIRDVAGSQTTAAVTYKSGDVIPVLPDTGLPHDPGQEIKKYEEVPLTSTAVEEKITADSIKKEKQPKLVVATKEEDIIIKKKTSKRTFALYCTLTPSLAFQKVKPDANDNVVIRQFGNPSAFSSQRLGFAFEGGIQGRLTTRLEYVAGLSVYHQSQTLNYSYSYANTSAAPDNLPGTMTKSLNYTMWNAGLQAGLLYTLIGNGLLHKIGGALQYQKGFYSSGQSSSSDAYYNNAAANVLNYQIMYRIELPVSGRMKFMIQPSLVHPITGGDALKAPFTLKEFRAGIGVGITRSF